MDMKKDRKLLAALAALVLLAGILAGIYLFSRTAPQAGEKHITVEVVHSDGGTRTFSYDTEHGYLGEVLVEEELIQGEEGPYGLYITVVDGEEAVYERDGGYWALYQGDTYAQQSVDQTPICDGDSFALVYTIG